jgi:hypothetical protein
MNAGLPRILKSAYRRDRWSLFTFGVGMVGLAIALRWWMLQRNTEETPTEAPQYYLPPQPTRPQLPTLNSSNQKKRPY